MTWLICRSLLLMSTANDKITLTLGIEYALQLGRAVVDVLNDVMHL